MAANYPDPLPIPDYGHNHCMNPGAEVTAEGVDPFIEYIPPAGSDPSDPVPPAPDPTTLTVTRATDLFHSGVASFRVDKTAAVDRLYTIGVEVMMMGLPVGFGCLIDYYIYLPAGSGANAGNGTTGLQPMPSIIDPSLPGPEDLDDTDQRRVSLTMRADPPTQEGTWLRQQVTFFPTTADLLFRLTITYNDLYIGPQAFYLDDINVWHDYTLGTDEELPPVPEPEPEPPLPELRPPEPTVFCTLDPRSTVTPIALVVGDNLFADARAYWYLAGFRADGTPRVIPPDNLGTFEHEYASYKDITTGYLQVNNVVRTDGHALTEQIQYAYPVPIQDGTFAIMDLDAPMDTWYQYEVTIKTNDPAQPIWTVKTPQCSINSSMFAPEYAGCSAALLSDPLVPSLAQWFGLTSIDPLSWPGRRELFEVISAQYPIAQADIRLMARTVIRGVTTDLLARTKMLEILATGRILRLRIPDPQYPEANWYLSVGAVTENRIHPDHRYPHRRWELEVAVVQRPVGQINSWNFTRTYQDVLNYEDDGVTPLSPKTYAKVYNEYTDYLAVLYGKTYSTENIGLPAGLTYGDGRWPTVQSVETSVNWLPELPVP